MVFQTMKVHNADCQKQQKILNPSQPFSIAAQSSTVALKQLLGSWSS